MGKAQAEREMDALVKKLWGLIPEDETPVKTEIERLRQKTEDTLAEMRAIKLPVVDIDKRLLMKMMRLVSIDMLETMLNWIDEIVEGE